MFDLIRANKRRSVILILSFVLLLGAVGAAVGVLTGYGLAGTIIALAVSATIAFTSYWKADAIALAVSRAKPAHPDEYKRLHNLVEGLCIAGGIPKPRVYIIDDPAPNAFATGRNPRHAAIAVTSGLLQKLNRVELEGGARARAVAHPQLRHPRLDARGDARGGDRAAHRHGDPLDVVERRPRPSGGRPQRRWEPPRARRLRTADLRTDPREADAGDRSAGSARRSPTSARAR
jgi:hypothetical protein